MGHLVISRKKQQSVLIGRDAIVTVIEIRGDKVRLGFNVNRAIPVHREEIFERIEENNGVVVDPVQTLVEAARNALGKIRTVKTGNVATLEDASGVILSLAAALEPFESGSEAA